MASTIKGNLLLGLQISFQNEKNRVVSPAGVPIHLMLYLNIGADFLLRAGFTEVSLALLIQTGVVID